MIDLLRQQLDYKIFVSNVTWFAISHGDKSLDSSKKLLEGCKKLYNSCEDFFNQEISLGRECLIEVRPVPGDARIMPFNPVWVNNSYLGPISVLLATGLLTATDVLALKEVGCLKYIHGMEVQN